MPGLPAEVPDQGYVTPASVGRITLHGTAGTPPLGGDQLKLLAEPTAQHIFLATSSAATWLDVSGDGGNTWTTALYLRDGGLGWSDFGFTTATQGVAIEHPTNPAAGTSTMYMTWDAGQTWHPITF